MNKLEVNRLKKLIKQKITNTILERQELKDILDHEDPADVQHAMHDAWAGGNSGEIEDENLVLSINHAAATSDIDEDDIPRGPETLDIVGGEGVITVSESNLRLYIRKQIKLRS